MFPLLVQFASSFDSDEIEWREEGRKGTVSESSEVGKEFLRALAASAFVIEGRYKVSKKGEWVVCSRCATLAMELVGVC